MVEGIMDKVKVAREWLDSNGLQDVMISVDGSVSAERAAYMASLGAQIFVGGTAGIYRKGMKLEETIPTFRKAITL
jgi:ribulose-phosphate 3-epimerase